VTLIGLVGGEFLNKIIMNDANRKFVVVTAVDVNKKELTKVTEVNESVLFEITKVAEQLKRNNKIDSIRNLLAETTCIFDMVLPDSYVKLYTIKEIKVLAVIGEIKLL
jgi:hypothetical protein